MHGVVFNGNNNRLLARYLWAYITELSWNFLSTDFSTIKASMDLVTPDDSLQELQVIQSTDHHIG
jgi:hypothetical protein